jgi:hypothetical protein
MIDVGWAAQPASINGTALPGAIAVAGNANTPDNPPGCFDFKDRTAHESLDADAMELAPLVAGAVVRGVNCLLLPFRGPGDAHGRGA